MKLTPAIAVALTLLASSARAETSLRWTYKEDRNADLAHVIATINAKTGFALTASDFRQAEDRDLTHEHYRRYDQIREGAKIKGMAIRLWTTRYGMKKDLVQLEAQVDKPVPTPPALVSRARRTLAESAADWTTALARDAVAHSDDAQIRGVSAETLWIGQRLVRVLNIKGRHGNHVVTVDLESRAVVEHKYDLFPHGDPGAPSGEYAIPALVYPVYEEYAGKLLPRQQVMLRHLLPDVQVPVSDPFVPLRDRTYLYSKLDPVKGETPEGQAAGYWSMSRLLANAALLRAEVPFVDNTAESGHALLQGKYVTVNIHPDGIALPGVEIPKQVGTRLFLAWKAVPGTEDYQLTPGAAFLGKPLDDRKAALLRDAARHPQHDPAFYINRGFDEVQVYWAVNQLFESLRPMGFNDPELSTRPFDAYLFDPDVESKDNAYYDSDTINFATYSPNQMNAARDNMTIWHELGHGVMDRLMGTQLQLADTGGLSEGMADFVAQLVLRANVHANTFPGQQDARIINSTGFFLTNEVHDDGEAYGGTMKVILDGAIAKYGEAGLTKVTDLVLEAMRLARDNPHLTAQDWFDHILFADELGRAGVRAPGELSTLIRSALAARNFADEASRARFDLIYAGKPVVAGAAGSRGNEIKLALRKDEQATEALELVLHDGVDYQFRYPVDVKIFYNSGPLQGAIDWVGEDHEPALFTISGPDQPLTVSVAANGTCDAINRSDGTCSDFAYVQIYNAGDARPVAKKRFYLRIKTIDAAP